MCSCWGGSCITLLRFQLFLKPCIAFEQVCAVVGEWPGMRLNERASKRRSEQTGQTVQPATLLRMDMVIM